MAAIIYTRVSSDTAGGRSVAEQEKECRADCAREGLDVAYVLCDNDRGASRHSKKSRPEYERIADVAKPGDVLVTWEASRAQRDLEVYVKLRNLCAERGIRWRYGGSTHDLSTGEGRFRTGLDALLSENEAEKTRERVLRAHRANAESGLAHGRIAYGYRAVRDPSSGKITARVPDELEANVVRQIARRVLAGETLYSIAKDLNRRGIATPGTSSEWRASIMKQMMVRPTYAGLRSHHGSITEGEWEPIISVEEYATLTAILNSPERRTHRGAEPKYLLSGIAKCGVCDAPVHVLKNHGYPSYACSKGRCVSRTVAKSDEVVVDYVLTALSDKRVIQGLRQPDKVDMQGTLNEITIQNQRLEECADQVSSGEMAPAFGAKVADKIMAQIKELEAELHSTVRSPLLAKLAKMAGPNSREIWEMYTTMEQRELLRGFFTVTINRTAKGRSFDPRSVRARLASA